MKDTISTIPISQTAHDLIEKIKGCRGQFIRVNYVTNVKPRAANKDVTITKHVSGIFRTGIDYANKASVREAIESGDRGEVQELPWGVWAEFPWIIVHNAQEYLRLYPVESVIPTTRYEVERDGVPLPQPPGVTTKEWIASFLTPADGAKLLSSEREKIECITKRISDLEVVGCWSDKSEPESE